MPPPATKAPPLKTQPTGVGTGRSAPTSGTKPIDLGDEPDPPAGSVMSVELKCFKGDLFKNGKPDPDDVMQGELWVCPVPGILLATAIVRPERVTRFIVEKQGSFVSHHDGKTLKSPRAFDVFFKKETVTVSPWLYYNDSDELPYAHSPNFDIGWVSFAEKGYAVLKGSYQKLNEKLDPLDVLNDMFGKGQVAIFSSAKEAHANGSDISVWKDQWKQIRANVKKLPTVAASRDNARKVVGDHMYVVLSIDDKHIKVRNPWGGEDGKPVTITIPEFERDFISIYQANFND